MEDVSIVIEADIGFEVTGPKANQLVPEWLVSLGGSAHRERGNLDPPHGVLADRPTC
jgi:hypothetical protein